MKREVVMAGTNDLRTIAFRDFTSHAQLQIIHEKDSGGNLTGELQ